MRIASSFAASTDSISTGTVKIVFIPMFNNETLELGSKQYRDAMGDSLYIDLLRFYVGNFALTSAGKEIAISKGVESYHLLDAENPNDWVITIPNVPAANYNALEFTVGVDSAINTTGAMSGDLDPVKGMYWAWNTGYIMAKIEGRSKVCLTLHHAFEFHIGGYASPYNTVRKASLPLPVNVLSGQETIIYINVNASAWFQNGNEHVDLRKLNDITTTGKEAMEMADRYLKMFEPVKYRKG